MAEKFTKFKPQLSNELDETVIAWGKIDCQDTSATSRELRQYEASFKHTEAEVMDSVRDTSEEAYNFNLEV